MSSSTITSTLTQFSIRPESFGLYLVPKFKISPFKPWTRILFWNVHNILLLYIISRCQNAPLVNNKQNNIIPLCHIIPLINHLQHPVHILVITKHNHSACLTLHLATLHIFPSGLGIFINVEFRPSPLHELYTSALLPLTLGLVDNYGYDVFFVSVLVPDSVLFFPGFQLDALCFGYNL